MKHTATPKDDCPEKLKAAEKKAKEYLEGWQRAKADYSNLKKQSEKERAELGKFARATLLVQLIPILENLRRAFSHVPEEQRQHDWVKGIAHIQKQFEDLLAQSGLSEIDAEGKKFDPALHEAVGKEKHEGKESGTILEVIASGWKIGDDVLVPSKVKIVE